MSKMILAAALGMMASSALCAAEDGEGAANPGGPNSASGRIKVATKDYDVESGSLDIAFSSGAQLSVTLDDLPEGIVRQLALHGLSQKLGDSYASVKGDVTKAFENASAVLSELKAGNFTKARAAGEGEGKARVGELAEAIARFKGVEVAAAAAAVAKASEEQVKAWRGNAKLKAIIATIRAEKAAAKAAKEEAKDEELEIDFE